MKNYVVFVLAFFLCSCALFDSSVKSPNDNKNLEKALQTQEKVQLKNDLIKIAEDKLEDKGKSLLHGGRYVLNLSTNKTPEIDVSLRFLDLAQLSLGNPTIKDAQVIEGIADGLLAEYKAENLRLKATAETNRGEIKKLENAASQLEKQHRDAELQLKTFVGTVNKIQEEKVKLESELKKEQGKNNDLLEQLAVKADRFDEENSLLNSLNPFKDLFSFFKKMLGWGVILFVGFIVFQVIEIMFPGVAILSTIISIPIKVISRILPRALNFAGLVSNKVLDAASALVAANNDVIKSLKDEPLEEKLLENFPEDKTFTKKETLNLLFQLTENTLDMLISKLDKHLDSDTRGVVSQIKAKTGIKNENLNVKI